MAATSSSQIIDQFNRYVISNYTRYPVCLVRGEESFVWDAEGKRYLDFFPGWGCDLLGHCPPRVVEAVKDQVSQLIHVPNTWYTEAQGLLAKALSLRSGFDGKCFFCNSGTEAVEAAIKLARLHGKPTGRYKIVSAVDSFHGRTFGVSAPPASRNTIRGLSPYWLASSMCHLVMSRQQPRLLTTKPVHYLSKRFKAKAVLTCRHRAISRVSDSLRISTTSCSYSMKCKQVWAARAAGSRINTGTCFRTQ